MAHSRWTVTPYAAAVAVVLALGACTGGGGAPAATPAGPATSAVSTTAAGPTTTSAPTTEDPALARIPAAARPETKEGAQAFARFFLESLNSAARNAEPDVLKGLFVQTCKVCVAMESSIGDLQSQGRRHAGDTINVRSTSVISFVKEERTVRVDVDQMAVDVLDANGRVVDRTLADTGTFVMTLSFTDNHWVASRLQTLAK